MKQNQFRLFIFLLAVATVYAACRKTDRAAFSPPPGSKEARFFADHAAADPLVQSINDFMKTRNEKTHFTDRVIQKVGYPFWDKAITLPGNAGESVTGDSVELTFIPIVRDTQDYVNATLAVITSPTDTSYKILCDWQYRDTAATGMPSKDFTLTMMKLDKAVFGNRVFTMMDTTIFDSKTKYIQLRNTANNIMGKGGNPSSTSLVYYYYICWTEFQDKHEGQLHGCYPGQPDCNEYNEVEVCATVSWEGGGGAGGTGGGGTGGTGGTGGGGGGGTGGGDDDDIPPDCGTASFAGSGSTSNLLPCDPGWMPGGGGSTPPPDEPIDTLLKKYSRAIKDTAVHIYDVLSKPANIEYAFTGVSINNQITVKHVKTNGDSLAVIPHVMIGHEILLFTWHSHVSKDGNIAKRGSFSPADIDMLRNVRCLTPKFVSFADCRNKRYALVITDVVKAKAFFNNNDYYAIRDNHTTSSSGNAQERDEQSIINVIKSLSVNGIAFYVSNDSPDFQTWTLLNP